MKATNEARAADNPVMVTFDTLAAAKKLTATGFDEPQAEAIVTTVHKAMSDTLATKTDLQSAKMDLQLQISASREDVNQFRTDLESQIAITKADLESQIAITKADLESQIAALRADLESQIAALRADLESQIAALRTDLEAKISETNIAMEKLRAELKADIQATNGRIDEVVHLIGALHSKMDTLQDRIVIRLGGVMVTMTVLLMALGPFYIRWVMSIIGGG